MHETRMVVIPAGRLPGRVCVLYAGGTIGARNLTPELFPDELRMFSLAQVQDALVQRDVAVACEFRPLREDEDVTAIVSSAAGPREWALLAERIGELYDDYDGFVVLHGTDTMAWTAGALAFMFTNLAKPVVLTGSQRPVGASPSDAVSNFVHALTLAGRATDDIPLIPEVTICFGGRILRGTRSQKISAASLRGFASANFPRLGRVGRKVDIATGRLLPAPSPTAPFIVSSAFESRLADVTLFPGMRPEQLDRALSGAEGVVLRTYGAGNVPVILEPVIESAVKRGAVVVNVSQCTEGFVESGMLSGNSALARLGVLTGVDLTPEAALTKLGVLLAQHERSVAIDQMMLDQRGEQSLDVVNLRPVLRERVDEQVERIVLSRSLHARVQPARLFSAVLRLEGREAQSAELHAKVLLNHWTAGGAEPEPWASAERDLRYIGSLDSRTQERVSTAIDITGSARGLLCPGAPVTVTLLSSEPTNLDVVLSLFVRREVEVV